MSFMCWDTKLSTTAPTSTGISTLFTANAARSYALYPGTPGSLAGALAWVAGILAVFIPLSVWRYRRMS